jgi:outer membrane receptor protein involved in Fe transport
LGTKSNLFGGRLVINADVFEIQWKKIQQEVYLPSCGGSYIANEGTAVSRGVELEAQARPVDPLTLGLAVGYTDAKFTQTVLGGSGSILVANGDALGGPPVTVTPSIEVTFPFASMNGYVRSDYTYTAGERASDPSTFSYDPGLLPDPPTHYLQLRAGVRTGGLNLSIFANNVTDSHPNLSRYHLFSYSPLYTDVTFRGRTLGVTAVYKFK